jgi:TonB family protein
VTAPGGHVSPEDPYAAPTVSIEAEVNQHAARSQGAFDRCLGEAAPVHGTIEIAFRVMADGRVANAAAVENSTGNTELARCLASTIASWRMSAHAGPALDFVRPFHYP